MRPRGRAGRLRGGDRLPWVEGNAASEAEADNFTSLTSLDWQAHVYGKPAARIVELCRACGLAVHTFPWQSAMAGLKRDALYLVRPDGYIGLVDPDADPGTLERYLDSRSVRATATAVR